MTTAIEKSRAEEIRALHNEITGLFILTLEKSIRVGELLTAQKAELKHGEFGGWVEENLSFSYRAANQYMQFYNNREMLLGATTITEARALLARPKPTTVQLEEFHHEATAAELKRIRKYVERDGLTEQQARRIIDNDAKEKSARALLRAGRKAVDKERLSVTITHKDKTTLERLAKRQDTTVTEWLRSILQQEINKRRKRK